MDQGYGTGVVRGVQWILYMFTRSYLYIYIYIIIIYYYFIIIDNIYSIYM